MSVSPLDYRYSYPEMRELFGEEYKLKMMLEVEAALAEAHAAVGNIPKKDAKRIRKAVNKVKLERVKEIEKRIHHDVMAVAKALAEKSGDSGKYVHYCATSYDIVDTMWGLILKHAIDVIDKDLRKIEKILVKMTRRYRNAIMVGRTHGQHALPITFGFKTALWASEIRNHRIRLKQIRPRVCVGKMSGAVGTFASYNTTKIQKIVMKKLGLNEPRITNQVVQREGYAEFVSLIAMIGATLEKIAKEIRNLARSEIKEVEEPFEKKQVGSSTMPQKRNPHKSER
ncbi:MAG: adenylosuccinate lyase, partial [Candidatus Diapherotrites archaeon]|nr:adenylosuccinate lyase [Candidatus Diapherotrites archaeon]